MNASRNFNGVVFYDATIINGKERIKSIPCGHIKKDDVIIL